MCTPVFVGRKSKRKNYSAKNMDIMRSFNFKKNYLFYEIMHLTQKEVSTKNIPLFSIKNYKILYFYEPCKKFLYGKR